MQDITEENGNSERQSLKEKAWMGVQKVLNTTTKNESANWKQTLSGALSDGHLFASLIILTIFYFGYAIVNAYHDNHGKDEDHVTLECRCDSGHRRFYIGWFTTCTLLWFFVHVFLQSYKYWGNLKRLCKCYNGDDKYNIRNHQQNERYVGCCSRCCHCCNFLHKKIRVIKKYMKVEYHRDIFQLQQYLASQYYELYVIGITKNVQIFNFDHFHKIIFKSLNQKKALSPSGAKEVIAPSGSPQQKQVSSTNKQTTLPNNITAVRREYDKHSPLFLLHCLFHVALKIVQFLAQLSVVPLLLIQIFDTYAFLCFTGDNYCTLKSEYKLHLDQTALTFAFYCSLTLSFLFSSMLTWIPWPKTSKTSNNSTKTSSPSPAAATTHALTNITNASRPPDYIVPQSQIPTFPTTAVSIVHSRLPASSAY